MAEEDAVAAVAAVEEEVIEDAVAGVAAMEEEEEVIDKTTIAGKIAMVELHNASRPQQGDRDRDDAGW